MPSYESFESEFISRFPQWKEAFEKEFSYYDDEPVGNYVILGGFLIPKIEEAVDLKDEILLQNIFQFCEEVSTWDSMCADLIYIEIGEWLRGYEHKEYVENFAGIFVKDAVLKIQQWHVEYIQKAGKVNSAC
jgi:hypothetical protein